MPAQTVFKLRRDTAANWTSTNPVLASGEPGLETDTRKIKYGDGTTAWTSLSYSASGAEVSGTLADGYVVRLDGTSGNLQSSGLVITDSNVFAKPAAETQYKKAVTGVNGSTYRDYTFDLSLSNYFSAEITTGVGSTPTVVATSSANHGSSTSGTLTLPTGTATGDVVIAVLGSDGGQASVTSSGWTVYSSGSQGTAYVTLAIKTMGATPDTTISFNGMGTASVSVATTYRGVVTIATPVLGTTSGTGSPNPASVTTTIPNSLVVAVGGLDDDTVTSVSAPTGYSNLVWLAAGTAAFTSMMASKEVATPGVEDPGAFTTGATDDWAAYTIVLEPAVYQPRVVITPATAITTAAGTALAQTAVLDLTYTSGTLTWDTDIKFQGSAAPTLTSGDKILLTLTTNDATNYRAIINSGY